MFEAGGTNTTNFLLERALDAESVRRKVISNNVANVDTPHFKRSEVNFESELKRAIDQNRELAENDYPGAVTDEKHIPFIQMRDVKGVGSRINLDYSTSLRNDGNNVDIEKEMVDAAKNLMRYNAFITSLNQNFKVLKMAMRTNG
ncbi:MAG TPA: flagellar basal body rod protein FlgB [Spirochaetota bacterium]|jgi:flagellar basal-body rod protein FlgB|nr:flagellar basal body rod protein FlgB [Spirochaetota bacterium]HOR43309.1 flagellar basal body rod protein FlgB [Spirochaetota bacterium]HOU85448.1 flagellar basal body rod protein FlgB [Spirochaetota bacterium]HPK54942.1 flagellar basal body rod protein FlgB [Spirochaetota bacterium]HQE59513.1 flagellar basal body rod protein FlgB [Spirochaetota bacterium]